MSRAPYPAEGYVLARLANTFFWLGYHFEVARDWCTDKPIIGNLAGTFAGLRDLCWEIKSYLLDRDVSLWMAVAGFQDLFEGWGLADLLDRLWWWWREFRDDPQRYIRERLADWLEIHPSMRLSWREFWYDFWDRYAPDINQIRANPVYWVTSKLDQVLAGIREFFADPVSKIVDWLNRRAEWFSAFLSDPWRRVLTFAQNFNAEVYEWLTRPVERLRDWLNYWLGLPGGFWEDPIRQFVYWVLGNLSHQFARYRDTLYLWMHELLMHVLEDEYW